MIFSRKLITQFDLEDNIYIEVYGLPNRLLATTIFPPKRKTFGAKTRYCEGLFLFSSDRMMQFYKLTHPLGTVTHHTEGAILW